MCPLRIGMGVEPNTPSRDADMRCCEVDAGGDGRSGAGWFILPRRDDATINGDAVRPMVPLLPCCCCDSNDDARGACCCLFIVLWIVMDDFCLLVLVIAGSCC
jgi:hypothetical protein